MRIAFFSDIHEDAPAFHKAYLMAVDAGCDTFVSLGDISGFSVPYYSHYEVRDANACADLITKRFQYSVAGNHDLYAVRRTPHYSAGFDYPKTWYSLNYHQRKKLAAELLWLYEHDELSPLLNQSSIRYFKILPEYQLLPVGTDFNILLSHFVFPDLSGSQKAFLIERSDYDPHLAFMEEKNCKLSFCGHAHIEGGRLVNNRKSKFLEFGRHQLKNTPQIIVGPAIVSSDRKSGFMIFDTETYVLDIVRLK